MYSPNSDVLVRGRLSGDGRHVRVAHGVELASGSVDIVTDVPEFPGDQPAALLLFFASEEERAEFADVFNHIGTESREI